MSAAILVERSWDTKSRAQFPKEMAIYGTLHPNDAVAARTAISPLFLRMRLTLASRFPLWASSSVLLLEAIVILGLLPALLHSLFKMVSRLLLGAAQVVLQKLAASRDA